MLEAVFCSELRTLDSRKQPKYLPPNYRYFTIVSKLIEANYQNNNQKHKWQLLLSEAL